MPLDPRFAVLFEPVQIGPKIAPNRFYQVPHCNGLGYRMPQAMAAMRGMKAEGGWGVVCTEEVEIHHTSDLSPFVEGRIWDDADIPVWELMVDAIHEHGSLAGIELSYNGHEALNFTSRVAPLGPRSVGTNGGVEWEPVQTRRADKEDIRNIRKWHRDAAIRAKRAGFDIVYCYAAHSMTMAMHFMLKRYNDRTDEYGGSLENRVRFFRELIEDTKEAVGDSCAVAVRFAVDELLGEDGMRSDGEAHDIVAMLAELPDLWDVNIAGWSNDSATSRFEKEGFQEQYIAFVKKLTTKPVVGVGRYTSPESMVSAIQRGVMDMIGAARPSIADPSLPNKIKDGRFDDIRECIGCNICVTGDTRYIPIRCTQNPTMGEEYRRSWHPEKIANAKSTSSVLVVGAGPAGLEAARGLGQRGYEVTLIEGRREPGGRVARESKLPGLSEWRRVMDWRLTQIEKLPNVKMYLESVMTVEDILESGQRDVIIATGAAWRRDGIGRSLWQPIPGSDGPNVFTPDDIMAGKLPTGRVVIYDDDHYYMGGLMAEKLVSAGCEVTLLTPAPMISFWTQFTLEYERIVHKLLSLGVTLHTQHVLDRFKPGSASIKNTIAESSVTIPCDAVVMVADRLSQDGLYLELHPTLAEGKLNSLRVIGDAEAPNIIAQAVFSGHRAAREFDEAPVEGTPFKVERIALG